MDEINEYSINPFNIPERQPYLTILIRDPDWLDDMSNGKVKDPSGCLEVRFARDELKHFTHSFDSATDAGQEKSGESQLPTIEIVGFLVTYLMMQDASEIHSSTCQRLTRKNEKRTREIRADLPRSESVYLGGMQRVG